MTLKKISPGMFCGLFGLTAVLLGAFGAHALHPYWKQLGDAAGRREWWSLAARYQLFHALVLGMLEAWSATDQDHLTKLSSRAMLFFSVGTIVFCGSLYVLAMSHSKTAAVFTPIGGVSLLAGWSCIILIAHRRRNR